MDDRTDATSLENLEAWLTTVVARICLDTLQSRKLQRSLGAEPLADPVDPETEALMADSVGLALLVILDTLDPAERLALVLHDMFDMPFDEIAVIVSRTPAAARQLASRARRRVRGAATTPHVELSQQRRVVEAFLAAVRRGDVSALLEVLDPDVVVRADVPPGPSMEVRGARAVAKRAIFFSQRDGSFARTALVNGTVGVVVAPRGHLRTVLAFKLVRGKIVELDVFGDPGRLRDLDLAILPE